MSKTGNSPPYSEAVKGCLIFGKLEKRGRMMGGWVVREFIMRDDVVDEEGKLSCVIFYYKTREDIEPHGKIIINEQCSVIPKQIGDRDCFILLTPEKEHVLFTPNKKISSQWVILLEDAIQTPPEQRRSAHSNSLSLSSSPTIKEPITRQARDIEKFYDVFEQLGEGGFAVVKRGIEKDKGTEVALKMIPRSTYKKSKLRTDEEIMVLAACDHRNVMKLYEVVHTETSLVMCLELLTGSELFERIIAKERYKEPEAKEIAIPLLEAVCYLHLNGIVHRDLKPENLIFDKPGEGAVLKLTDFGFATIIEPNKKLKGACGTPEYVAPEVIADKAYDQSADMWSCGVILYILLCGYPPFYGKTEKELFEKILQRKFEFHPKFWSSISPEAKDLIAKLLELNPLQRLTAKQALQHPWLKKEFQSTEDMGDSLIQLKRYNAGRKFKKGVMAIVAATRLSDLM